MKPQKQFSLSPLLLLPLVLTAFFVAGCAKPTPPPMATETPAQINQDIKDHAASYKAFRESHPNAYTAPAGQPQAGQPQSGGQ